MPRVKSNVTRLKRKKQVMKAARGAKLEVEAVKPRPHRPLRRFEPLQRHRGLSPQVGDLREQEAVLRRRSLRLALGDQRIRQRDLPAQLRGVGHVSQLLRGELFA